MAESGRRGDQGRKNSLASRALHAPDGKAAQADAHRMGVASQTIAAVTGRFVGELKTQREDEGEDKLDKCFAVVHQPKVGGFILEIDGDGAVSSWRFGSLSHVSPSVEMAIGADETSCGERIERSRLL